MTRSLKYLAFLVPTLLGSLAQAKSPPNFDAYAAAKPTRATFAIGASTAPPARASSFDDKTLAPTFLWTGRGASSAPPLTFGPLTAESAARAHLAEHAARYGLSPAALATAEVTQIHDLGRGGIVVVLRQAIDGIEVFHYDAKVLMDRSFGAVAIGGHLHPAGGGKPRAGFVVPEARAIALALGDLYGASFDASDLNSTKQTKAGFHYYDLASNAAKVFLERPARAKKVYFPLPDRLLPAFYLEVWSSDGSPGGASAYAYVIAADDGRLLYRENLTHDDAFNYRVWADTNAAHRPTDGPMADFTPHPTGMPDKSYPPFVAPTLVTMDGFNTNPNATFDPWLLAGATETNGNNVDAYTDDDAPDGFSANDLRGAITSPGAFDRVFDTSADPQSSPGQRMAAVTQIFYVTNWLHDWWYDSGFVEAAGVAQKDNYGRGGVEGDPLHAEAQDGAPMQRNNANMSAGVDGDSPRMQMYVWDGTSSASLTVSPPNQSLGTVVAQFGPLNFGVTGSVVLVNDGTAPITDACQAITNNVSGKIAFVDRGTCTFKQKAVNAQAAGAIGVIMADNQAAAAPPVMQDGAPNGNVTIPMMSMTEAAGAALKTSLQNGPVTATLESQVTPSRDGTIDNTVVAHEWGHYLHLRQVACDSPQCLAESEGWGDFDSAMLELRGGDNLSGTYATAQYATAAYPDPGYFGIRRYPYSTDLTKDPLTFKDIQSGTPLPAGVPMAQAAADNAEPHNAGEIWATMLFESYVALLVQSGGPNAPYTFEEAHRRMGDYVEAGLKLAPTNPTYTEQRDGILAAAAAADPGDFALMAQGFAKRGAGTCAVSPARDSTDLTGVVESFTLNPNLEIVSIGLDDSIFSCDSDGNLDADETGKLNVVVMNAGPATMTGTTVTATTQSADLTFPSGNNVVLPALGAYATATAAIVVKLAASVATKETLPLSVTVENADACTPKVSLDSSPLVNFDEKPMGSATDDVEASKTTWTLQGTGAQNVWSRIENAPGNHLWQGIDYPSPTDTMLESPPLVVSAVDALVLTFSHRYSFETSMGVFWDGGVIEMSTDGTTWVDVSTISNPGYGGTIGDPQNQATNVLKGRKGFVAQNASWPAMDTATVDMGMSLAGKTIEFRFRIGTDDATGAEGWQIDNIGLAGITNLPFNALIDDQATCSDVPIAKAGPDQTVTSGDLVTLDGSKSSDPANVPLTFAWSETAGPSATLSGAAADIATFTAPLVASPTTVSFQLKVSNGEASAGDQVDILVNPPGSTSMSSASGVSTNGSSSSSGAGGASLKANPAGPFIADDSDCGCEVPGTKRPTPALPLLALLPLALYRRRRRALS